MLEDLRKERSKQLESTGKGWDEGERAEEGCAGGHSFYLWV